MRIKTLVVDDHPLFIEAMTYVLHRLASTVEVLQANNIEQATSLVEKNFDLDLMLIDLCMPSSTGVSTIAQFHQTFPSLPVVVISAYDEEKIINQVMQTGAMGFVPKSLPAQEIIKALQLILQGEIYVPPPKRELGALSFDYGASKLLADKRVKRTVEHGLTAKQIEVLKLVAAGFNNKEICQKMSISESTVKIHLSQIYYKLGVSSRLKAIESAKSLGIINR